MKSFKLRFIYAICVVVVCALYLLGERSGLTEHKQTHFTVTSDTNVSKVPGLSKYVSQEEVDSFAFRYWDIDDEAEYTNSHWEENATLKKLRLMLKAKDTRGVLNFLKDNNLSVNLQMHAGTSPLIYSAFYDDENTARELIKLGADMRHKDRYKLSPLAYAIENNSTKTAKLLLDNGVKFEEVKAVQTAWVKGKYDHTIVDGNKVITKYKNDRPFIYNSEDPRNPNDPFGYIIDDNFLEMAKIVLESGYRPYKYTKVGLDGTIKQDDNFTKILTEWYEKEIENYPRPQLEEAMFEATPYALLIYMNNYEEMLDLLLKYDVSVQPSEYFRLEKYKECKESLLKFENSRANALYNAAYGIDHEKETFIKSSYVEKYGYRNAEEMMQKDHAIRRKPYTIEKYRLIQMDQNLNFYRKFCGESNAESVANLDAYSANTEKTSEAELSNQSDIFDTKTLIGYLHAFRHTEPIIVRGRNAFLKDENMTQKEYYSRRLKDPNITWGEACRIRRIYDISNPNVKCLGFGDYKIY